MPDIFEFWSQVERGTFMHPSDQKVFERINPKRHGFQLNCLPGCFGGPLLSAPGLMLPMLRLMKEKIIASEARKAKNLFATQDRAKYGWRVARRSLATTTPLRAR